MNELKIFENEQFGEMRVITINNEPWFVGKDVAEILGYSNTRKALADHVEEEDKTDGVTIRDSIGREQNPIIINESGLYSLIFSSKLPSAKQFKHWVTHSVLPALRRYGIYKTTKLENEIINNSDFKISINHNNTNITVVGEKYCVNLYIGADRGVCIQN